MTNISVTITEIHACASCLATIVLSEQEIQILKEYRDHKGSIYRYHRDTSCAVDNPLINEFVEKDLICYGDTGEKDYITYFLTPRCKQVIAQLEKEQII